MSIFYSLCWSEIQKHYRVRFKLQLTIAQFVIPQLDLTRRVGIESKLIMIFAVCFYVDIFEIDNESCL